MQTLSLVMTRNTVKDVLRDLETARQKAVNRGDAVFTYTGTGLQSGVKNVEFDTRYAYYLIEYIKQRFHVK